MKYTIMLNDIYASCFGEFDTIEEAETHLFNTLIVPAKVRRVFKADKNTYLIKYNEKKPSIKFTIREKNEKLRKWAVDFYMPGEGSIKGTIVVETEMPFEASDKVKKMFKNNCLFNVYNVRDGENWKWEE